MHGTEEASNIPGRLGTGRHHLLPTVPRHIPPPTNLNPDPKSLVVVESKGGDDVEVVRPGETSR